MLSCVHSHTALIFIGFQQHRTFLTALRHFYAQCKGFAGGSQENNSWYFSVLEHTTPENSFPFVLAHCIMSPTAALTRLLVWCDALQAYAYSERLHHQVNNCSQKLMKLVLVQ